MNTWKTKGRLTQAYMEMWGLTWLKFEPLGIYAFFFTPSLSQVTCTDPENIRRGWGVGGRGVEGPIAQKESDGKFQNGKN